MAKRSRLMMEIEERYSRSLERLLPELVNELGLTGAAAELKVSKSTVNYWLLKFGINVKRVVLSPGESLEVKRVN